MRTVEDERDYVLARVGAFVEKLKAQTDPMDIEASIYMIARIADCSSERVHRLNRAEPDAERRQARIYTP